MAPHSYLAYGAFVVGVIGGIAFTMWSALLQLCRIDDPTDSSAGLYLRLSYKSKLTLTLPGCAHKFFNRGSPYINPDRNRLLT